MKERKRKGHRVFKTKNTNKSPSKYQELSHTFDTLKVNGIKFPIKRQGWADLFETNDSNKWFSCFLCV